MINTCIVSTHLPPHRREMQLIESLPEGDRLTGSVLQRPDQYTCMQVKEIHLLHREQQSNTKRQTKKHNLLGGGNYNKTKDKVHKSSTKTQSK